jgi:hypothetical protein
MTEHDAILVQILAATDAVWRPLRRADWARQTPGVVYEYRHRFPSSGVPLGLPDPSETGRKAVQRGMEDLASRGFVTLHGRERRASVRLTEHSDILARQLVGLPNVNKAHAALRQTIELQATGDGLGPLTSELWLAELHDYADTDKCRQKLIAVQESLLPALWRGWVESNSDCVGRVWYWATDLGRKVAKLSAPTLPSDLPSADVDADKLYSNELLAYRARLRNSRPDVPGEIGFIPLPASIAIRRPKLKAKRAARGAK